MKRFVLSMILLLVALGMFAQGAAHDVIITHDAQRIDAVITEVSAVEVKYKQANFPTGPTFVVAIDDIATIIYSNGKVQAFQKKARRSGSWPEGYGQTCTGATGGYCADQSAEYRVLPEA